MAVADPQLLGRYRLNRKLGSGAMGVVYEALDPKLNRTVAIKTILKSHLDEEVAREYSVRFREEAQAVARLNHPNIVQVYDFGEEADVAFIVMEFIRGKDLALLRQQRALRAERVRAHDVRALSRSTTRTRPASSIATSSPPT